MRTLSPRTVVVQTAIFCSVNVLALIRWGRPDPWSRLDRFSIAAILLLVGMGSMKMRVDRALGPETGRLCFGEPFDPLITRLRRALRLTDLLALVDYSNGPLVPAIASPVLQLAGAVLAPAVMIWMWQVDSYLIAHFPATLAGRMMQDGPFRRIRHPRYLGIVVGRFAFAAMLGSVFGWAHFIASTILFSRRMAREERHLREMFPGEYEAYMRRAGRIFPKRAAGGTVRSTGSDSHSARQR